MASPFGKILLITGATSAAELLAERARERAVAAIRSARPEVEISRASAGALVAGELAAQTSPSLFSESTALVLTELENLGDQPTEELKEFATSPHDDIAVVLVHGGGNKGKGLLDALRKAASVDVVKLEMPKYERGFVSWVKTEAREQRRSIDDAAAAALVMAVGEDLRGLAGAIDQLAVTLDPGQTIDAATVARYFGGRADVKGFAIADAVVTGNLTEALEQARWAETNRTSPVPIVFAVGSALRQIALVASAPPGLSDGDVAAHAGVPPFKVRTVRQQARGWSPAGLRKALDAVAAADLEVKGAGADAHYSLERMLIKVSAASREP